MYYFLNINTDVINNKY